MLDEAVAEGRPTTSGGERIVTRVVFLALALGFDEGTGAPCVGGDGVSDDTKAGGDKSSTES